MPVRTSVSSTATCTCDGAGGRLHREDGDRRSRRSSAARALAGRLARPRRRGVPARGGADRQGDRPARWVRPAGCPGADRHLGHAPRAGEPRSVRAGSGQARRSRADHAARQHDGDGEGRRFGRVAQAPPGRSSAADATIPTSISLDDPAKARGLDRAPVQVDITTTGVEQRPERPGHRARRQVRRRVRGRGRARRRAARTGRRGARPVRHRRADASRSTATCARATAWRCRR